MMIGTRLVGDALDEALGLFRNGDFASGQAAVEKQLTQDLGNEDLKYVSKCVAFWGNRFEEAKSIYDYFEAGEYFLNNWKPFLEYMQKDGSDLIEPFIYTFRSLTFRTALGFYAKLYSPEAAATNPQLCRRIGLCFKALGNYEQAVEFLRAAFSVDGSNSKILAELADAYELYGESRTAKVFFREAFFENAGDIDPEFLESHLILGLIEMVNAKGFVGKELMEWLPVYGYITRVLSLKRELKPVELGHLKQRVFWLENEIRQVPESEKKLLLPRLINSYLWLIDKYSLPPIDQAKIDELLLKIRILDDGIYRALVN